MARIPLVVDEEEKQHWVRLAHQEEVTLNEWLRRAARARAQDEWPTDPGAPRPVPLSEWPEPDSYITDKPTTVSISADMQTGGNLSPIALEEAAVGPAPADAGDLSPASGPSASSASCRRIKIHHIYHAGQPCPLCNFPLGG
jgi:hypothetical protein